MNGTQWKRSLLRACLCLWVLLIPGRLPAVENDRGSLLMIGGGLQLETASVYLKFIELAGGKDRARIGILPCASPDTDTIIDDNLMHFGVPRENIQVINILPSNAVTQARNPAVLEQIRRCTGLFIMGGIQRHAALALLGPDGRGTPALDAIREVYRRGGVIGGTSAGATVQGTLMISTYQLPIDTLDFGLASTAHHRGVIVTHGLDLFGPGLVDQHFNDSDGRLARLCRALIDLQLPLGFGIDEDTAMLARPDGLVEVLGNGGLTIVEADKATLVDGPKGVSLSGVVLHHLEGGDTFDPKTRTCRINPGKSPIEPGKEAYTGNQIVADLSQADVLNRALTRGLIDNTADSQTALLLRFNGDYGHGYRFTFSKTGETRGYRSAQVRSPSYAAVDVHLDVRPVVLSLDPATVVIPRDIGASSGQRDLEAIAFRGILPVGPDGRFRTDDPLTRAEFADALIEATVVTRTSVTVPTIADVPRDHRFADEIITAVAAGLMDLDRGAFHPDANVSRRDVADALARAARHFGELAAIDLPRTDKQTETTQVAERGLSSLAARPVSRPQRATRTGPLDPATREDVAKALAKYLDFPW